MGHLFEKFSISVAILLVTLTSCLSCVSSYRRVVVAEQRSLATPDKLWPSIALVTVDPKKEGAGSLATGWAIDKDHIVTAGHFCEGVMEGIKLEKLNPGVLVIGSDNHGQDMPAGKAVIVAFVNNKADDICLLFLKNHGLKPLPLETDLSLVETEDPVTISGAPRGVFPFRTDGYIWAINDEIILLDMLIAPGNSGSPLQWNGKIIGMVISTIRPGPDVNAGAAVRGDKIQAFFEKHRLTPKRKPEAKQKKGG